MVSLKDERGNLHAPGAHPQACPPSLAPAFESGIPQIPVRMPSSERNRAPSELCSDRYASQLSLVRQFNPSQGSVSLKTALDERRGNFVHEQFENSFGA